MEITINRIQSYDDYSLSTLKIDGKFMSFVLEDEKRTKKVKHETRIPAGQYQIKLRIGGLMNEKYKKRFPFHIGMLHLKDVPNFEYIYIHCGNNDEHTSGCLLVGMQHMVGQNFIGSSAIAYELIYKLIIEAMQRGETIICNIIDEI